MRRLLPEQVADSVGAQDITVAILVDNLANEGPETFNVNWTVEVRACIAVLIARRKVVA